MLPAGKGGFLCYKWKKKRLKNFAGEKKGCIFAADKKASKITVKIKKKGNGSNIRECMGSLQGNPKAPAGNRASNTGK